MNIERSMAQLCTLHPTPLTFTSVTSTVTWGVPSSTRIAESDLYQWTMNNYTETDIDYYGQWVFVQLYIYIQHYIVIVGGCMSFYVNVLLYVFVYECMWVDK